MLFKGSDCLVSVSKTGSSRFWDGLLTELLVFSLLAPELSFM